MGYPHTPEHIGGSWAPHLLWGPRAHFSSVSGSRDRVNGRCEGSVGARPWGVRTDLRPEFVCPLLSEASFTQPVSTDLGKEG